MAEHTKEPWHIRELRDDCFITAEIEPGMAYGPEIMGDDYTGYGDNDRKKADARRIVACVNACASIPTELLETEYKDDGLYNALADFNQQVFELRNQRELHTQRAELFVALERLEQANENLSAARSQAVYDQMIVDGQLDLLHELDSARAFARHAIENSKGAQS